MWSIFRPFVYVAAGRICTAYPVTQIVMLMVACVTSGFVAPGVQARSGKPFRLTHEFGGRIALPGGGTIAAAVVGVGVGCEGIGDAVAAAPPQLTAKTATTIRRASRNRGLRPTKIPPFPWLRLQADRPNQAGDTEDDLRVDGGASRETARRIGEGPRASASH